VDGARHADELLLLLLAGRRRDRLRGPVADRACEAHGGRARGAFEACHARAARAADVWRVGARRAGAVPARLRSQRSVRAATYTPDRVTSSPTHGTSLLLANGCHALFSRTWRP
jgi:hypothetical protein